MEENQQKSFNFKDTTATKKIFTLKKRIRAVAGGTSASKTISILIWLIDYCQSKKNANKIATVVSESFPHLEKGAMLDFEMIMKDRGYWNESLWHGTKHQYTFETGAVLEFTSMDNYGKAHGPRRDMLFINEANNIDYNIADQLIIRTREAIWLDWNPTSEFWFYTEMLNVRDDVDFITLTYKDNEALDENTIKEIESHRNNKAWWRVYGLGLLGEIEGRIYTGWNIVDEVPHEARLERYGLDFGYSNDPTAVIAVYRYNDGIILDEILYQKGLFNKDIADVLKNIDKALVIADSAEPKSIAEISSYGVPILKSKKGRDSVNFGIKKLQFQRVSVTKRSTNLIKEYRSYMWEQDSDGKWLTKPIDYNNHCLDASRYAVVHMFPKPIKEITTLITPFTGKDLLDKTGISRRLKMR